MMNAEIKSRIEQVQRGEVPDGWQLRPLRKIASPINRKAKGQKLETLSISAGIGFVNQAEKFGKEMSGAQYVNYTVLQKGDFSYNKGNSKKYPQGCIYMLEERKTAAVPNVFNSFRMNSAICDSGYYANLFIIGYLNRQLCRYINSGVRNDGLLNLYDEDFYSCEVPVPPIAEQQKIAGILVQCDKIISLKQELLDEKRKQKKLMMRKLLKRQATWVKATIGKLTTICAGATPSTKERGYWNGDIRWMSSGELNLKQVYEVKGRISEDGLKNSGTKMLPENCLLVGLAGQGKTRGTVAINHVPLCTNQSIAAILPCNEFVTEFMFWNLESRYMELRKLSSGDGARGGLNLDLIGGLVVYLPPIYEQKRIANILSTTEKEIYLLEQELAAWKEKKKGLAQLLLTGLVRV